MSQCTWFHDVSLQTPNGYITMNRSIFNNCLAFLSLIFFSTTLQAIPEPGDDGSSSAWITMFNVNSAFAKVGKPVTVTWSSSFTVGCSLWTSQTGSQVVSSSGTKAVVPTNATVMSVKLNCAGENGSHANQVRSFQVNEADHPELHALTVDNSVVDAFTPITLTWNSSFSDYCFFSGSENETLPANGSKTFDTTLGTNVFFLQCKSDDGRVSNMLSQTVTGTSPFPTIGSFYYVQTSPGSYNIVWFSYSEYCVLDGFYQSNSNGVYQVTNNTGYVSYHSLTCFRNGYSTSESLTYYPPTNGGLNGSDIIGNNDKPSHLVTNPLPNLDNVP